jgi:hypothetical protein
MKRVLCWAIVLAACRFAWADGCCDHCGCHAPCRKVCRLVCEIKKVPKTTYDCEQEQFCVPGPSCRSTVCDECGQKHQVYTPTCAKVRTRTKLVKHETFEQKVVYKWVVENVCCSCAAETAEPGPPRAVNAGAP